MLSYTQQHVGNNYFLLRSIKQRSIVNEVGGGEEEGRTPQKNKTHLAQWWNPHTYTKKSSTVPVLVSRKKKLLTSYMIRLGRKAANISIST